MRMSNTNNFSASFNVATPYQMVVIHSSKLIYPRELYQRGIVQGLESAGTHPVFGGWYKT